MRRYLVVGPTLYDWDLGSYIRAILSARKIPCEAFAYVPFGSRLEANRQLLRAVEQHGCDVLLGLKLDWIEPSTIRQLRARGIFCFLWYVDCFGPTPPPWIRPLVSEVDAVAITAKGLLAEYNRLARRPVSWIYEGVHLPSFSPHRPVRVPDVYRSQVAFVGNIYHPAETRDVALQRERLLKRVQRRFQLKVWGPQGDPHARSKWGARYPAIEWPAYNDELVRICRGAGVVLGINHMNDIELYFSNRTFLTLASGGFHITRYVPGLETMFRNREHLMWYHSEEECVQLIDYYLAHPRIRSRIARAGRDWVRRRYSMTRQVNRILRIVDQYYGG